MCALFVFHRKVLCGGHSASSTESFPSVSCRMSVPAWKSCMVRAPSFAPCLSAASQSQRRHSVHCSREPRLCFLKRVLTHFITVKRERTNTQLRTRDRQKSTPPLGVECLKNR